MTDLEVAKIIQEGVSSGEWRRVAEESMGLATLKFPAKDIKYSQECATQNTMKYAKTLSDKESWRISPDLRVSLRIHWGVVYAEILTKSSPGWARHVPWRDRSHEISPAPLSRFLVVNLLRQRKNEVAMDDKHDKLVETPEISHVNETLPDEPTEVPKTSTHPKEASMSTGEPPKESLSEAKSPQESEQTLGMQSNAERVRQQFIYTHAMKNMLKQLQDAGVMKE